MMIENTPMNEESFSCSELSQNPSYTRLIVPAGVSALRINGIDSTVDLSPDDIEFWLFTP